MWIDGLSDILSGLAIPPFLLRGSLRTTALLFSIAILIPVCDGLMILEHRGFASPILIQWGMAVYMTVATAFLFRKYL